MDKRFVYVTVKMEITNPNKEVNVDDFHINTEIVDYECN